LVSECVQTDIHSSLGAAFSVIEDCGMFYCNWQKPFFGCDQAMNNERH